MLVSQADELPVPVAHGDVRILPCVRTAVVRIAESLHADLIAVVDARHPRIRHLQERREAQPIRAELVVLGVESEARLMNRRHAVVERRLAQERDRSFDVVAADEVHHHVEIFLRVVLSEALQKAHRLTPVDVVEQEVQDCLAERIVHRRVNLLPAKVLARHAVADLVRRVLPDLADEDRVGVRRLEFAVERLRELRGQFVDDVETPAADARLRPMVQHAVLVTDHEVHVGRRRLRHVRQRGKAPPTVVFVRILMEVVPAVVGRLLRLERAEAIVIALAVEVDAVASRMAEYAVEDDADALGLRRLHEILKLLVRAEDRIDLVVVARIVVVVARRLENGIEIDDGNAKLPQVGKFRLQPLDIAAEEIVLHDFFGIDILVVAGLVAPVRVHDGALLLDDRIALAAEAIGEDLVHDGVLRPVGGLCPLVEHGDLKRRRRVVVNAAHAAQMLVVVAVIPCAGTRGNDEIVP